MSTRHVVHLSFTPLRGIRKTLPSYLSGGRLVIRIDTVGRIFHSPRCSPTELFIYAISQPIATFRDETARCTPLPTFLRRLIQCGAFILSGCRTPHPLRCQFTRSRIAPSVYFDPRPPRNLYPAPRTNGIISSLRITPVLRRLIAASNCLICWAV